MTEAKANETMLAKFDLGSDFLKSSDMLVNGQFKAFTLTIDEFFPAGSLKGADKKPIKHPVISFKETKKKMVLNNTSQEILHLVSGTADGTKTPGTKVTLEARVVEAFGDICLGLRLMPNQTTMMRKGLRKHLGQKAVWEGQLPKEEQ